VFIMNPSIADCGWSNPERRIATLSSGRRTLTLAKPKAITSVTRSAKSAATQLLTASVVMSASSSSV
jgi:hypothetical protein